VKQVSDNQPWLMPEVINWLWNNLRSSDTVLETGAGGSTVFFSHWAARVITYEHNPPWAAKVKHQFKVELRHRPDYPTEGLQPDTLPTIDLAFIDGRGRVRSVLDVLPKMRSGGWLILDDSDRPRYADACAAATERSTCRIVFSDPEGNHTTCWRIR
jgi:hypothetical protein